MMRKYVNFIFAKDWNYMFPEADINLEGLSSAHSAVAVKRQIEVSTLEGKATMVIRMERVTAVEFFERDFEAEAEAKAAAEAEQEAADAEPRH